MVYLVFGDYYNMMIAYLVGSLFFECAMTMKNVHALTPAHQQDNKVKSPVFRVFYG